MKRIITAAGVVFFILAICILVIPLFISGDFTRQKVEDILEDRFHSDFQVGPIDFRWPNRINISSLTIHTQERNRESQIQFDTIHGTVKFFPLFFKKFVAKKISIRQVNYENWLLIKDLVTDKFSYENGVVFIDTRLLMNEGPTTIRGTIDVSKKRPVFDLFTDAKDIHVTQDVPTLQLIPLFMVKEGEFEGFLSFKGSVRGKGLGKDILNKKLNVDMSLAIRDGYIRGNKLLSSILEIMGIKDAYSFNSMESIIQIKEGKIYTPRMDIQSQIMSLNATGTTDFEGKVSYNAVVKFNKERLGNDIEKIAGLLLSQNELPIEIRGTTRDPKVAVKIHKDNLEHIVKGLVKDFLNKPKEKRKKEQ